MKKAVKYACLATLELFVGLIFSLPRYRTCNAVKSLFLRCMGAKIGKRVIYYPGVWICSGRHLVVGDDVDFAKDVLVGTDGGVTIGDRCLIGFRTQILAGNHRIPPVGQRIFNAGHDRKPVRIGHDVWIGGNCMILAGTTIGEGAVVGAGSVVTRDVPPYAIVAGVPARLIRMREGAGPGDSSALAANGCAP